MGSRDDQDSHQPQLRFSDRSESTPFPGSFGLAGAFDPEEWEQIQVETLQSEGLGSAQTLPVSSGDETPSDSEDISDADVTNKQLGNSDLYQVEGSTGTRKPVGSSRSYDQALGKDDRYPENIISQADIGEETEVVADGTSDYFGSDSSGGDSEGDRDGEYEGSQVDPIDPWGELSNEYRRSTETGERLEGLTVEQAYRMEMIASESKYDMVEVPKFELEARPQPEPVVAVLWTGVDAQSEVLKELFAESQRVKPRQTVYFGNCSGCRRTFSLNTLSAKRITFGPINPKDPGPCRQRIVAWYCPDCLVQDLDFRRPQQRGRRGTYFNTKETRDQ